MQIITGKYRARKLVSANIEETRPTLARVKESVFNLVQDKIADSVVLDLFAGSGAFGVECISRYAKKVYFVDSSQNAISAIKTNTKNMTEDFEIIKTNYLDALSGFAKRGIKFDLVYLDPPYNSGFYLIALQKLKELDLLNSGATIVVEFSDANNLQNLPDCYIIKKSKKYGIAYINVITFEL